MRSSSTATACSCTGTKGKALAYTRNGLDWSEQFAPLCQAAADIPAASIVLDGEVVVPGQNGVPNFGAVRGAISKAQHRLIYYAFDLLYLDGFDLRGAALEDRRRVLAEVIAGEPGKRILFSETISVDPGVDLSLRGWHLLPVTWPPLPSTFPDQDATDPNQFGEEWMLENEKC